MFLTSILRKTTGSKLKYVLEIALAKRGVNLLWEDVGQVFTKAKYGDIYNVYSWLYAGVISLNMQQIRELTNGHITVDSILEMLRSDSFVQMKREFSKGELDGRPDNFYPFNPDDDFEVTDEVIQTIHEDMGEIIYKMIRGESLYVMYTETFPGKALFIYFVQQKLKEPDYMKVYGKVQDILALFPKYLPSYSEALDHNMIGLINSHLRNILTRKEDIQQALHSDVTTKFKKGGNVFDAEKERKTKFYDLGHKEECKDVIPDIINIFNLSKTYLNYSTQSNDYGISTTLIEVTLDKQLNDSIDKIKNILKTKSGRSYSFEKNSVLGTSRVIKDTAKKNESEGLKLIDKAMAAYVGVDSPEMLSIYNRIQNEKLDIVQDISIDSSAKESAPSYITGNKDRVLGNVVVKARDTSSIYLRDFLHPELSDNKRVHAFGKTLNDYYLRIPTLKGARDFIALCRGVNAIRNLQNDLKTMPNINLSDCIITSEEELQNLKKAGSIQNYLFSNNFDLDKTIFEDKFLAEDINIELGGRSREYNGNIRNTLLASRIQETNIDYSGIHMTDPSVKNKEIMVKRQAPGKAYGNMWLNMMPMYYGSEVLPSERIKHITPTSNIEFYDRIYKAEDCGDYITMIAKAKGEKDITGIIWDNTVLSAKQRAVSKKISISDIQSDSTPFRVIESMSYMNFINDIGVYELIKQVITDVVIPFAACQGDKAAFKGAYFIKDMIETGYILDEDLINNLSKAYPTQENKSLALLKLKNLSLVAKTIRSIITCKDVSEVSNYCKYFYTALEARRAGFIIKMKVNRDNIVVDSLINKFKRYEIAFINTMNVLKTADISTIVNEAVNYSYLYDLFLSLYGELFWALRNIGYDVVSLGNYPTNNDNEASSLEVLNLMHNMYISHRSTLMKTIISKFRQMKDAYTFQPEANAFQAYNSLEYKFTRICEILNFGSNKIKSYVEKATQIGGDRKYEAKLQELCNLISVDNIQYLENYYSYVFEHSNNQLRTTLGLHPELDQVTVNVEEMVSKALDVLMLQTTFVQPSLAYRNAMKQTPFYRDKEFDSQGFATKDGKIMIFEANGKYYLLRKEGYLLSYDGVTVKPVESIKSVQYKNFDKSGRPYIADIAYDNNNHKLLDSDSKTYFMDVSTRDSKYDENILTKAELVMGRITATRKTIAELENKAAMLTDSNMEVLGISEVIDMDDNGQYDIVVSPQGNNTSLATIQHQIDNHKVALYRDTQQFNEMSSNLREVVSITITKVL